MRIGIANDHHGIELKARIIKYLRDHDIKYINYGCDEKNNVDYIDYAKRLSYAVVNGSVDLGILICGTGIGMSIAANKIKGIRAAKVNTPREAALAKEHNMANIMTLAEYTENLEEILDAFINTENSKEERHIRRVERIAQLQ